jgi:hypothetical protein
MRLVSAEDISHSLALVRSKGGDINKRLHLLIPCSRDHDPSVRVTRKNEAASTAIEKQRMTIAFQAPIRQQTAGPQFNSLFFGKFD